MTNNARALRLLVLAALGLTVVWSAGCGGISADQVVANMKQAYAEIDDYTAVLETTLQVGDSAETTVMRQWVLKPHLFRSEMLEPEDIAGQVTLFDGESLWFYDPAVNEVIVFGGVSASMVNQRQDVILGGVIENLLVNSKVSLAGSETVGGREAYVLELHSPKDRQGPWQKLWVDKETWLPFKITLYDRNELINMTVVYREFTPNVGLKAEDFVMEVPEGAEVIRGDMGVRQITLAQAAEMADFELMVPSDLPQGLELVAVEKLGEGENVAFVLRYEAGRYMLTLTESLAKEERDDKLDGSDTIVVKGLEVEVVESDGMLVLHWYEDDVEYAVLTNLTLEEARRVLESLEPAGSQ